MYGVFQESVSTLQIKVLLTDPSLEMEMKDKKVSSLFTASQINALPSLVSPK